MRRSSVTCGPGFSFGLAAVALATSLPLGACGLDAQTGDCGALLSSAECAVARTQLGRLADHPPADPSNRFGRCVKDGTSECLLEDGAVKLGKRLFFDRCLSIGNNTGCVTCHEPKDGFIDSRSRPIQNPSATYMVNGTPVTMAIPYIQKKDTNGSVVPLSPDQVTTPAPTVQPLLDATGTPLAKWDGAKWVAVVRRPQASFGSVASGSAAGTARHSPSLYNIAYGGVMPPNDGARTAGVIWAPWDGRYDSHWSLVADVFEFGGTQNTDRAHIALRIFLKHRAEYEAMTGRTMADFQSKDVMTGKFNYPRHGSPGLANKCWYDAANCTDAVSLPPTPAIRDDINSIFVDAGKALSAYMRRLRSNASNYDRWVAGDVYAMSPSAQRGLRLFQGKAECVLCHNGPNFTDGRFHNLGVPSADAEGRTAGSALITTPADAQSNCFDGMVPQPFCPDPGRSGWQARASDQCVKDSAPVGTGGKAASCQRIDQPAALMRFDVPMDCRSSVSDVADADKDRLCLPATLFPVSKCAYTSSQPCQADTLCQWADTPTPRCFAKSNAAELGQMKTPTLRNVALTFPYMHNGALFDYGPAERGEVDPTDPRPHLRRVINFYNAGGGIPPVGTLDPQIRPLGLTSLEVDDLVEFLTSLTDNSLFDTNRDGLGATPTDLTDTTDCPM